MAKGSIESLWDEKGEEILDDSYLYYWNGMQLATEEEFDSEMSKIYSEDKAVFPNQYTYKEIQERINSL